MANLVDGVEQDWREIMASKASKWNKKSRRLSHLTISTHSPPPRYRSPVDSMEDVELDGYSSWSETESSTSISTGFSRSVRSRATTLSVYSGISCSSQDDLDGRDEASVTTIDDDDVSTTSEVPEQIDDLIVFGHSSSSSTKWVEDDLGLRSFPTKHVDYLSHDWREVDIWASWRHLMSKKNSYNNEKRLENACWRVWGKKRYDLKTVSPESLNWLKDCDVTWLYGPLQPGPIESLKALSLEDVPSTADRLRRHGDMVELKPILKRRSVSEKMLVRSLLSASLLKQATAAVEAERSARARSLPFRPLHEPSEYFPKSPRPTSPTRSRSSSTASLRPLLSPGLPDKKRIHFQEQVEQCIALENSESESDSYGAASEPESDHDGGVFISKRAPFVRPGRTQRRVSRSAERRSKIIAKLPSTTLNCRDENSEPVTEHFLSGFWRKPKISPPPSPSLEASNSSLPVANFMLNIEDRESIMGWRGLLGSDEMSKTQEMNGNIPFPCLVCKDSWNNNAGPGRIFESRNDWLVHLWAVHQDPGTWAPSKCLWEGCGSSHQYRTASMWLGHVHSIHHRGRQHKRQKLMGFGDDKELPPIPANDKLDEMQGLSVSRKVFDALASAKDIGSFLLHSASEPLAAHIEWLRRSKTQDENQQDLMPPEVASQYFRNLARRILGFSTESHTAHEVEQDSKQEALVERLAETLSLYSVDSNLEGDPTEDDISADPTGDSLLLEHPQNATSTSSALYSLLTSIRQSLIQVHPPSKRETDDMVTCGNVSITTSSPVCSEITIVPTPHAVTDRETPSSMILPIRGTLVQEATDIHSETDEDEATEYDSSELEDLTSDASAYGEASEDSLATQEEISTALEPMRQALVDRVMDEFWVIFNQNWDSGFRERGGGSHDSSSPSNASLITSAATTPLSTRPQQRKRQRDDDMGSDDEEGNMSRKPKRSVGPSDEAENRKRFACPFRKHDARRYSTYSYRVCALSHWETIARVKEHIYRCHRMPTHCKRCWKSFKNQELLDAHLTVDIAAMCELTPGHPPEGITSDQERRLRSRKKSSRDQSDEGRWREMYQLLFPGEEAPSPYFESVQDEMPGSPDTRDLANYEAYMRRELPRLVRTNIEDVVRRDMQPLEAALIGNLVGIIQDCQDRLFRGYRQMRGDGAQADATASPMMDLASASFSATSNGTIPSNVHSVHQQSLLESAFQPPPPALVGVETESAVGHGRDILRHEPSLDMVLSDSGYASELPHFCDCPGPECSCSGEMIDSYAQNGNSSLNNMFACEELLTNGVDMQWDGWDAFPSWDSLNSVGGGFGS